MIGRVEGGGGQVEILIKDQRPLSTKVYNWDELLGYNLMSNEIRLRFFLPPFSQMLN